VKRRDPKKLLRFLGGGSWKRELIAEIAEDSDSPGVLPPSVKICFIKGRI